MLCFVQIRALNPTIWVCLSVAHIALDRKDARLRERPPAIQTGQPRSSWSQFSVWARTISGPLSSFQDTFIPGLDHLGLAGCHHLIENVMQSHLASSKRNCGCVSILQAAQKAWNSRPGSAGTRLCGGWDESFAHCSWLNADKGYSLEDGDIPAIFWNLLAGHLLMHLMKI